MAAVVDIALYYGPSTFIFQINAVIMSSSVTSYATIVQNLQGATTTASDSLIAYATAKNQLLSITANSVDVSSRLSTYISASSSLRTNVYALSNAVKSEKQLSGTLV